MFKEEEEAIKVDLHEGCGRTKLFWVMALADSKALKAMVEFREGSFWFGFSIARIKAVKYNNWIEKINILAKTFVNLKC